jgi:hypothetical protein
MAVQMEAMNKTLAVMKRRDDEHLVAVRLALVHDPACKSWIQLDCKSDIAACVKARCFFSNVHI